MNKKNIKHISGFTLIELLVVVAIIGVLATFVVSSLNSARLKAEDARVEQVVNQLKVSLEMYYLDNGRYPEGENTQNGNEEWSNLCDADLIEEDWTLPTIDELFKTQLEPYFPGIQETRPCTNILYWADNQAEVGSYYENACNIDNYNYPNGYIIVYQKYNGSEEDQYWFWTDPTSDAKWYCRTHER